MKKFQISKLISGILYKISERDRPLVCSPWSLRTFLHLQECAEKGNSLEKALREKKAVEKELELVSLHVIICIEALTNVACSETMQSCLIHKCIVHLLCMYDRAVFS